MNSKFSVPMLIRPLAAVMAVASFASAAQAQTEAPAPSPEQVADQQGQSYSGDIIVTAQKREQNLQDVPVAVQSLGAAQLEANSVRAFTDLNRVAPSLVVRPDTNPVNASVSIRGIGTFAFAVAVEPSVAVVLDDVPLTFQARAFADLSDVERIEVLRGPQSTLYGKSASAGLISIVTPKPSSSLTGRVAALVTTDNEYQAQAMLSGPIGSTLGFRSTVNYNKFEGNVRNVFDGSKLNGRRIFSTRNKLQWQPSSDLTFWIGLDYINGQTTSGLPIVKADPTALLRGNAAFPLNVFAPGITVGPENLKISNDFPFLTRYRDFAQSGHVDWDIGPATLISVTSHNNFRLRDGGDGDNSALPVIDNRAGGEFTSEQLTQELRLVSNGKTPFRYTLGMFYSNVDYSRDFIRGPVFSNASWHATAESTLKSVFGQLEFDILPTTTLIAGGRYSNEKVNYSFLDRRIVLPTQNFFSGGASDNFGTYKLGLQHRFTDDVSGFLTYATGYKGQTYDLTTGFGAVRASFGPIKPETSKDWELGLRTQFLDRRLTFNVTLFNSRYRNFQAQGLESFPDGTINFRLANVGKLRTRGIEVETAVRPTPDLSISGSIAYVDAIITEYPDAQCYPGQPTVVVIGTPPSGFCGGTPTRQDLAGFRPAQAPKWKLNVGFDWSRGLGNGPLRLATSGAYTYQSKVNYNLNQNPNTVQKGYGIANLSIGIREEDRRWEVMAFVNNLFDQQYYENIADSSGTYGGKSVIQAYIPRDFNRYFGIRAAFNF
jgi:iron complex outermembrane recepter protein